MVLDKLGRLKSLFLPLVVLKVEMSKVGRMWIKGFQFIFYNTAISSKKYFFQETEFCTRMQKNENILAKE